MKGSGVAERGRDRGPNSSGKKHIGGGGRFVALDPCSIASENVGLYWPNVGIAKGIRNQAPDFLIHFVEAKLLSITL